MKEDYYINLIYKKLSEEINASEKTQLDEWLKESLEHQQTAREIEQVWKINGNLKPNIEVDLDQEFSFLETEMQKESSTKTDISPALKYEKMTKPVVQPEAKTRNLRPLWLAAASIFVLLIGGFLMRSFFEIYTEYKKEWVIVKTGEETEKITLADNSTVFLNSNTSFEYPKKFTENNRLVKLEGEAFFKVEADSAKAFIVETPDFETRVLGTSFNVKAYASQQKPSVHVVSGKVQVQTKDGQKVELTKGEKGILNKKSQQLQEVQKASPNILTWHTKKLVYKNMPLTQLEKDIETWYDVELQLNKSLKKCKITADIHIERDNIEIILEVVKTIFDCKVKKEEKEGTQIYKLLGGRCR